MSLYSSFTNTTSIEGVDNAQISNIDCDNLIVRETVDLPDLIIPSDWIISLDGDKINNPLKIDMIQEKTTDAGVTIDAALTVNGGITSGIVIVDNLSSASNINVESLMAIQELWLKDSNQSHYYKIVPSNLTADANLTLPNISSDTFLFANASQTVNNKTLLDSVIYANYTDPLKRVQFDLASISSPYLRTVVFPDASGDLVLNSATQTLTNKTLTTSTISGSTILDSVILANSTNPLKRVQFDLATITSPYLRTVVIPDVSGTMVLDSNVQTLSNKTLIDTTFFANVSDPTKRVDFYCGSLPTNTVRTMTFPNADGTLVLADNTQTLTNKTISSTNNTITITSSSISGYINANQIGTGSVSNTEFGYIDGLNQSLSTTSSPTFAAITGTGKLTVSDTTDSTSTTSSSSIKTSGGLSVAKDVWAVGINGTGKLTISDTTDSTGITTNASIKTSGGLSVAKDIWATSFYGRYRNQYCCQLTVHWPFTIGTAYVYTKITSLQSGDTNGFNNSASTSMDAGGGTLYIPVSGVYRITARCYNGTSGQATMVLGKNGAVYDRAFDIKQSGEQCALTWIDVMNAGDTFCIYVGVAVAGDVGGTASYKGIYLMGEYLV